jgi:hypothetical protein
LLIKTLLRLHEVLLQEVSQYRHSLHAERPIEFVELFLHKLFIKQETAPLLIFDVRTSNYSSRDAFTRAYCGAAAKS